VIESDLGGEGRGWRPGQRTGAVDAAAESYPMPICRQNSGCARVHRSCSRPVRLAGGGACPPLPRVREAAPQGLTHCNQRDFKHVPDRLVTDPSVLLFGSIMNRFGAFSKSL